MKGKQRQVATRRLTSPIFPKVCDVHGRIKALLLGLSLFPTADIKKQRPEFFKFRPLPKSRFGEWNDYKYRPINQLHRLFFEQAATGKHQTAATQEHGSRHGLRGFRRTSNIIFGRDGFALMNYVTRG